MKVKKTKKFETPEEASKYIEAVKKLYDDIPGWHTGIEDMQMKNGKIIMTIGFRYDDPEIKNPYVRGI